MTKHNNNSEAATMNALWNTTGRTAIIKGQTRIIVARRLCYGAAIQLTLNRPLDGCSSRLFTVEPSNLHTIVLLG